MLHKRHLAKIGFFAIIVIFLDFENVLSPVFTQNDHDDHYGIGLARVFPCSSRK